MNTVEKLVNGSNHNLKMLGITAMDLRNTTGFYCRLYNMINNLADEDVEKLKVELSGQNFRDPLDVIFWLEQ